MALAALIFSEGFRLIYEMIKMFSVDMTLWSISVSPIPFLGLLIKVLQFFQFVQRFYLHKCSQILDYAIEKCKLAH